MERASWAMPVKTSSSVSRMVLAASSNQASRYGMPGEPSACVSAQAGSHCL